MKKLLLIALSLGSTLALANPAYEFELEHLQESRNYEARLVNQDLTVSLVKPKFSNPTGEGALFLSAKSNLDGVCRLYGLKSYVPNSKINYDASKGLSVVIDESSRFSNFDQNSAIYVIGTITCTTYEDLATPMSDNLAARYLNDDGSETIKTPQFMMNGKSLYLSAKSDLDGVCKLYGLTSYVPNSKFNYDAGSGNSVVVDASSKFSKFDSNSDIYAIGSLMCR